MSGTRSSLAWHTSDPLGLIPCFISSKRISYLLLTKHKAQLSSLIHGYQSLGKILLPTMFGKVRASAIVNTLCNKLSPVAKMNLEQVIISWSTRHRIKQLVVLGGGQLKGSFSSRTALLPSLVPPFFIEKVFISKAGNKSLHRQLLLGNPTKKSCAL